MPVKTDLYPPIDPLLVYSAMIRLLVAFLVFSSPSLSPVVKAILIPIMDMGDVAHSVRFWLSQSPACPNLYAQCGDASYSQRNWSLNLWTDKIVDFCVYLLFYRIVIRDLLPLPMRSILGGLFLWRLWGILALFVVPDRAVLLVFPDFLNSSFLVLSLFYTAPGLFRWRGTTVFWSVWGLSCAIKYGIEFWLYRRNPVPRPYKKK